MSERTLTLMESIAESLEIGAISAETRAVLPSAESPTHPSYDWIGFPEGIGFAQEVEVASGRAVDYVLRQTPKRKGLTLSFAWKGSDAYGRYQAFCRWFASYMDLDDYRVRISYLAGSAYDRRFLEVAVTDISLDEAQLGSCTATVVFQALTPWYEEESAVTILYESAYAGKTYDYEYPYTYSAGTYAGSNRIENDYLKDIPLRIVLRAPDAASMASPTVSIIELAEDGVTELEDGLYGTVSFNEGFSLSAGETLTIDAMANRIYRTKADGTIEDAFGYVNKGGETFLYLRPGISRIAASLTADAGCSCTVEYQRYVV